MDIRRFLLAAILFSATLFAAPQPKPPVSGAWRLVFAEEFNGTNLNPKVWMKLRGLGPGYREPYNPDMDDSAFDAGYTTVSNGVLRFHWKAAPITVKGATYPYTTGVATTATGFNFRYGVIEARIWLPRISGIAPTFWLLPTPVDSTWPPEIDIAEFSTGAQGKVDAHFNVHYQKNGRLRQIAGFPTYGENLGGAWHTYTLDWRPDSMTMLLDGKAVYRYTGEGILDVNVYRLIQRRHEGEKPGPGSMLVDYVRVWQ